MGESKAQPVLPWRRRVLWVSVAIILSGFLWMPPDVRWLVVVILITAVFTSLTLVLGTFGLIFTAFRLHAAAPGNPSPLVWLTLTLTCGGTAVCTVLSYVDRPPAYGWLAVVGMALASVMLGPTPPRGGALQGSRNQDGRDLPQ